MSNRVRPRKVNTRKVGSVEEWLSAVLASDLPDDATAFAAIAATVADPVTLEMKEADVLAACVAAGFFDEYGG